MATKRNDLFLPRLICLMKTHACLISFCLLMVISFSAQHASAQVQCWLTTHDGSVKFTRQKDIFFAKAKEAENRIAIDKNKTFQIMDGFGYTLSGGSATLMHKMNAEARKKMLAEMFSTSGNNIGISYIRLSIGASDMNAFVYSYDDMPQGETDEKLTHFSLAHDDTDVVPVMKEILQINPNIKILGSPWSAPVWMKDNGDTRGGSLKKEYEKVYAQYFVKYVQEMKKRGITIDAITVQNEPLHPGNNPSMLMLPEQQRDFIKNSLGPAFRNAGIKTKIIVYDHNLDRIDYPLTILKDPKAAQYVDGSAFHLYGGVIEDMSKVHDSFPNKNLYFTEQWTDGRKKAIADNLTWYTKNLVIGAPRNWAKTVLQWNLANSPDFTPFTDRGGCNICLGAITIDGDNVTKEPAYYIIAHASKFIRPGSVRVASNITGNLQNVAYKTPSGKLVLIVLNEGEKDEMFTVTSGSQSFDASLGAGSVATYVW